MADSTFRSAPAPEISQPHVDIPKPDATYGESGSLADREPIDPGNGAVAVLNSLGISDEVNNLSEDDKGNLGEVEKYIFDILKTKNSVPNNQNIKRTMDSLREEMGLSEESDPSIVLDRIGGVVKSWKNLSFVSDVKEKRNILFKLARMQSSKEMNKAVYDLMNKYEVWE